MRVSDNCFIRLYNEINDIEEQINKNLIKVIPLGINQKYPNEKDYYNKEYTLKQLKSHKGNLGVCVGYNHELNNKSLAVIDIDGYTYNSEDKKLNKKIKEETSEYIYNCLKDIPGALIVKTQSGGKHIYFWNETITDNIHETSKALHFPYDFSIEELRGKSLNKSIEIFTKWKSKQCVLPGSTIKIKEENKIRKYEVISTINNLEDIHVVNDIHKTVKEALTKKGFTYQKPEPSDNNPLPNNAPKQLIELSPTQVKEIVNLLKPHFLKLNGMKNNSYLYLGGYLYNKVTPRSTKLIVQNLLKATDDNYPKHIKTALSNYEREGYKKGLPSLFENISSVDSSFNGLRLNHELGKIIDPNYKYTFLRKEFSNNKKQYINIDYQKQEVTTHTWEKIKDKTTGKEFNIRTNSYTILNLVPLDFYESYNILDKNTSPEICFTYYRKGMPYKQTIKGKDMDSIEKQLKKRPGLVLKPRDYQGLLNEIIKEYVRLEQMHIVAEIPIQGIFINPLNNQLARADKNGEIQIIEPTKEDVINGLEVWKKLKDIYKGDLTKLSHILRYGIKCPFSYIFKTEYEWLKLLFLYGVTQTAKTTLASIALSPYAIIDDDISIGGSSADTEYRMGNALSRQGIGCIINEPSKIIETNSSMVDLLKRAVESKYCREKMEDGVHVKIPAYSNIIFTSNSFIPTHDAFIRRSEFIEFTKSERMTEEDKIKFKEVFHHVNWRDTDFNNLRSVGDCFVYYVSENMDVLKKSPKEFVNTLLDNVLSFAGEDKKDWSWIYNDTHLMDIGNSDSLIIEDFRNMVLQDYYKHINANNLPSVDYSDNNGEEVYNYLVETSDDDVVENTFKHNFLKLASHDVFPYLFINNNGEVCVRSTVGKFLNNYCGVQISGNALADLLGKSVTNHSYKGKKIKSFKFTFDEFKKIIL